MRKSSQLVEPGVSYERHKEPTKSIVGQVSVHVGLPKDVQGWGPVCVSHKRRLSLYQYNADGPSFRAGRFAKGRARVGASLRQRYAMALFVSVQR